MFRTLLFLGSFFCLLNVSAQISDLLRIEYVGTPINNDVVAYDRYRALLNLPIKVKENTYLLVGLDYSSINLDIAPSIATFDTEPLAQFKILNLNLGYTYKVSPDWRFAARLASGFGSNFTTNRLKTDDLSFATDVVFIKNKKDVELPKKPTQLILGVSVANNRGFPILPFISYYRKFHSKWSYNIGIPKANFQWHINDAHRLKAVVRLDGFSGNIQNGLLVNESLVADRFRLRLIVSGLRYEFKLSKHVEFYINGSYILQSNASLRKGIDQTLFEFNDQGDGYIKTGLRFKI